MITAHGKKASLSDYTGDMEFYIANPFSDSGSNRFALENLFNVFQYNSGRLIADLSNEDLYLTPELIWLWTIPAETKLSLSIIF